ncbi:hypothetical protein [Actinoplanes couchii]|uniref:Integral membrane protein n=1 Tax=Actinoplanes couchii TaxID=403638 RepID=A0ABQ3X4G6_9ACTN|nr:hypothetical protein [Actinoplanes couchii]MDR6326254.1 hypothetical protein [Actinoplanes couchii]GID53394.1 hypothetical protein Aco03nite_017980 [Actinoplanes couchii]
MHYLAPSPTEVTIVTALTVGGVVLALVLLAVLAMSHRSGRGTAAGPAGRPARGLVFLATAGAVALFFGARVEFVDPGRDDIVTLFEMHGTAMPVYWLAYSVNSGLLVLLTGVLIRYRHTLRRVAGPPALLAAAQMNALMITLYLKLDHLDAQLVAQRLPGVQPGPAAGDAALSSMTKIGWGLAVLGVATLTLVVVLVLAGPHELRVATWITAGLALLAAPVMPDSSFWGLRDDGAVEHVAYTGFEIGGPALWWAPVLLLVAALLCAIPVLPARVRGAAILFVAATPVWLILINVLSYDTLDARLAELLRADGFDVAAQSMGVPPYLFMVAVLIAAPVVAVRSWRAASKGSSARSSRRASATPSR